jgi:hypothetical protein
MLIILEDLCGEEKLKDLQHVTGCSWKHWDFDRSYSKVSNDTTVHEAP